MITIVIPGLPVPKARPRATVIGGAARLYTPGTTRAWEAAAKLAARSAMAKAPPREGALFLSVTVHLPVPQSWSKAKRADALAGRVHPTARPDLDNYVKAALDALNGEAWRDDAQVVWMTCAKVYDAEPRVVVTVSQQEARACHA